jgi:hypothetical protein
VHEVTIDGRTRPVPATWNEFTRPLLLELVPVLYAGADSPMQLRLRVLRILLQVSWPLFLAFTDVQLAQIIWLADFALDEVLLTRQLLPTLQVEGRRRWWAPRENFRNLRMLEFIFADAYFIAFSRDPGNADYLDQLVATLYRPERMPYLPHSPSYGGDRREDFNSVHVARRAAGLKNQLPAEKLAVYTWYRGCREQLQRDYPLVFTPANEEIAQESHGGWAQVAREMTGPTFGTLEQTERQLVRDVLAKMSDDARQAERLRQLQQQQTPS